MIITKSGELAYYQEDISNFDEEKWLKAMQEEKKSLHENHTFELVKFSKGRRVPKNKWVYQINFEENKFQPRYKA